MPVDKDESMFNWLESRALLAARGPDEPSPFDECEALPEPEGLDPLMLAAARGFHSGVDFFASATALAERAPGGWTALMFAARAGELYCVRRLAAQAGAVDDLGLSALAWAARADSAACVKALAAVEDVDGVDGWRGWTPLAWAADAGAAEACAALLAAGADPLAPSMQEPLVLAMAAGCAECVAILAPLPDAPWDEALERGLLASEASEDGPLYDSRCLSLLLFAGEGRWTRAELFSIARQARSKCFPAAAEAVEQAWRRALALADEEGDPFADPFDETVVEAIDDGDRFDAFVEGSGEWDELDESIPTRSESLGGSLSDRKAAARDEFCERFDNFSGSLAEFGDEGEQPSESRLEVQIQILKASGHSLLAREIAAMLALDPANGDAWSPASAVPSACEGYDPSPRGFDSWDRLDDEGARAADDGW